MKVLLCVLVFAPLITFSQEINNLVLPPGYPTTELGKLENVKVFPNKRSKVQLVLIPGWGLDDRHYADFIKQHASKYEVHIVNVPGFNNNAVPPIPKTSYGDQVWTNAIVEGVRNYIESEKLKKPIVVGHLLTSTQIAIRLGVKYPALISGVIIIGGPTALQMDGAPVVTLQQRIQMQDTYYGPKWFKIVSKSDWNSGNYPTWFYSSSAEKGSSLYNAVAENAIPVMVQYLEEFNAQDTELELDKLNVKALVMLPDFANAPKDAPINGMIKPSFIDPWKRAAAKNKNIKLVEVTGSHAFVTIDQPEVVRNEIEKFLKK
jgi:pimeloyl-ACP methyl ester carboxylesterase